jgi:hypothetical protein
MGIESAAGVATALATMALTAMAYLFSRRSAQQAARRTIGDLANSVAMFRVDWPSVMRTARWWSPACWPAMYGTAPSTDADSLTRYYSYVDVGLEFCNSVLVAAHDKHITRKALDEHYGPLVRLFMTENWPIVEDMLRHTYISPIVRSEVERLTREGWGFRREFDALAAVAGT